MSRNRWRFSKPTIALGVFGLAVGLLAGLTALVAGGPATGPGMGLVDDWTHHHLIFSNPGTAVEALAQGRLEQWYRIVNDPRYIMQQAKRNHVSTGLTANTQDFSTLYARLGTPVADPSLSIFRDPRKPLPKKAPALKRDWAVSLGTGGVAQNMYPAKFTFDINATPSCANDFVVYGLNTAATAAVAASQTGSFTGQPTGGQTVTIGGTEVLTATPSPASITGTIASEPATGSTLTITGLGNTLILQAESSTSSSCTFTSHSRH